jgi:hypothetical protein
LKGEKVVTVVSSASRLPDYGRLLPEPVMHLSDAHRLHKALISGPARGRKWRQGQGFFTFLPQRPLLTLYPNRAFCIPALNESALGLWYSIEQLEARGLHENGRVSFLLDTARPWRKGWHPPLAPIAAGHRVDARQESEDNCPTFHRNRAGGHPVIRFDGLQSFLELTPWGTVHECMSGPLNESCFTMFIVVSAACVEGSAPWPIFTAFDFKALFSIQLSADVRQGETCYVLSVGSTRKFSLFGCDLLVPHLIVIRKDIESMRWWMNGTELDAIDLLLVSKGVDDQDHDPCPVGRGDEEPPVIHVSIDRILIARSVVQVEGAIPGLARHHFFDGELAELLVYRTALSRRHIDEIGLYFARKFRLPWELKWRQATSSWSSQDLLLDTNVETLAGHILETGPETIAGLQALLTISWSEHGSASICGHTAALERLCHLITWHDSPEVQRLSITLVGNLAGKHREAKEAFLAQGVMRFLLQLCEHAPNVALRACSADALAKWTMNDLAAQDALLELGGLDILACMLQARNARLKTAASMLLSNLFADLQVARKVLANDSIFVMTSAVVELMLHDDIRVQVVTAKVVCALLARASLAEQLLREDANLLHTLNRLLHSKVEVLQQAVLSVLSTALLLHPALGHRLVAMPALLSQLLQCPLGSQDPQVAATALSTLTALIASSQTAEESLCRLGLLDLLLQVLERRGEEAVQYMAVVLVAALRQAGHLRVLIRRCAPAPSHLNSLSSHHAPCTSPPLAFSLPLLHLSPLFPGALITLCLRCACRHVGLHLISIASAHAGRPLERITAVILRQLVAADLVDPIDPARGTVINVGEVVGTQGGNQEERGAARTGDCEGWEVREEAGGRDTGRDRERERDSTEMSVRDRRQALVADGLLKYLSRVFERGCLHAGSETGEGGVRHSAREVQEEENEERLEPVAPSEEVVYEACSCVVCLVSLDSEISDILCDASALHLTQLARHFLRVRAAADLESEDACNARTGTETHTDKHYMPQVQRTRVRPSIYKLTTTDLVAQAVSAAATGHVSSSDGSMSVSEKQAASVHKDSPKLLQSLDVQAPTKEAEQLGGNLRFVGWQALRAVAALVRGCSSARLALMLQRTDALHCILQMSFLRSDIMLTEAAMAMNVVCVLCSLPEHRNEDYALDAMQDIATAGVIEIYVSLYNNPTSSRQVSGAAFDVVSYMHNFIDTETFVDADQPFGPPDLASIMARECAPAPLHGGHESRKGI